MGVSSTTSRVSFAGNGVTTTFSFPYYFLEEADLVVIITDDATGVPDVQTLTTDYTVTGEGVEAGGSITMLSAPASGKTLTIYRDPEITQESDWVENDPDPAAAKERAFDKLTMVAQRLNDRADRSVTLPDGFAGTFDPTLPDVLEEGVLMINADGDGFEIGPTAGEIDDAIAGISASATAAAASASAAATSASGASTSASSALSSASAASASASSAAAALASAFFRDVVYITSASSPVTIAQADNGKLYSIDSSGGAITINLPSIAGLTTPFNVAFKLKTAGNTVTINRNGTDVIDGATSTTLSAAGTGIQLAADTSPNPDEWTSLSFGTVADGAISITKQDATTTFSASDLKNLGLTASVSSNAMTIALTDASGSNASSSSPVKIAFRNATAATGTPVVRSVTGALSVVVSSGSTLGSSNGFANWAYVYAIDNAGTVELAVCGTKIADEGTLYTTTAEGGAGAADSKTTLYSATARSNVAVRLIGRVKSTQATAGTWATAPSEVSLWPFEGGFKQDEIWLIGGNGFGSTNTKIAKFSSTQRSIGSAMTYNSGTIATLGTEITINEDGVYIASLSVEPGTGGDTDIGFSIDSTQLTTSIASITDAHRLAFHRFNNSTMTGKTGCTVPFYAFAGSIVRPHAGAAWTNDGSKTLLRIVKVA